MLKKNKRLKMRRLRNSYSEMFRVVQTGLLTDAGCIIFQYRGKTNIKNTVQELVYQAFM